MSSIGVGSNVPDAPESRVPVSSSAGKPQSSKSLGAANKAQDSSSNVAAPQSPVLSVPPPHSNDVDVLEAFKGKLSIRSLIPFVANAVPPPSFKLETKAPSGIVIEPPRVKLPKGSSKTLAEPGHSHSFSLHTTPPSLSWMSADERASFMHGLNKRTVNVAISGTNVQSMPAGAAYALSATCQGFNQRDVASLIVTDPTIIIPALQNAQYHALLSEDMIPHIASKFVFATRFDLQGEKLTSMVALQLAVRDVIASKVDDLSYGERHRQLTAEDLETMVEILARQVSQQVFHDVSHACKRGRLSIEAGVQALAIATLVVPGALRILGAQINNHDAAVQHWSGEIAALVIGTAARVGVAAATHGLSELVNLAIGRIAEKAIDQIIEFLVGVALPVRSTLAATEAFENFCSSLEADANSLRTRQDPELQRRAALIGEYLGELRIYWKATADLYPGVKIAEAADLQARVEQQRQPGLFGGVRRAYHHLRREQ